MLLLSNDWGHRSFGRVRGLVYSGLPLVPRILAFVGHLGCPECQVGCCGSGHASTDFLLDHLVPAFPEGTG